jgi:hypothetical protein
LKDNPSSIPTTSFIVEGKSFFDPNGCHESRTGDPPRRTPDPRLAARVDLRARITPKDGYARLSPVAVANEESLAEEKAATATQPTP